MVAYPSFLHPNYTMNLAKSQDSFLFCSLKTFLWPSQEPVWKTLRRMETTKTAGHIPSQAIPHGSQCPPSFSSENKAQTKGQCLPRRIQCPVLSSSPKQDQPPTRKPSLARGDSNHPHQILPVAFRRPNHKSTHNPAKPLPGPQPVRAEKEEARANPRRSDPTHKIPTAKTIPTRKERGTEGKRKTQRYRPSYLSDRSMLCGTKTRATERIRKRKRRTRPQRSISDRHSPGNTTAPVPTRSETTSDHERKRTKNERPRVAFAGGGKLW